MVLNWLLCTPNIGINCLYVHYRHYTQNSKTRIQRNNFHDPQVEFRLFIIM